MDAAATRSRRQGLLIASVSLLAGIALDATLLNRLSVTDDDRRSTARAPRAAAPSAVPDRNEATTAAPAGPTGVKQGVPAGFARSAEGAVAAAASFVCTRQALLEMDPLAAEEAIRQMSSAATAERQVADILARLPAARSNLAPGTGPTVYRQAAVAWRVDSFSPDRARVAVWNVGVLARDITSGFAAVLLGLVAVVAALLLWVELIVRSSLVYLLVAISPLGFAATLWPSARGFVCKIVEILLAVILSKFVISIALAIGVAALAGAGAAGTGEAMSVTASLARRSTGCGSTGE